MSFSAWFKERIPKIYLLNTQEYPKYEYPLGTGVMHEYPHYVIAGKKLPTGHVALGCLVGIYATYKLFTLGSSSTSNSKKTAESGANVELKFPAPQRDFDKEKEEFIKLFMEVEEQKSSFTPVKH